MLEWQALCRLNALPSLGLYLYNQNAGLRLETLQCICPPQRANPRVWVKWTGDVAANNLPT